MGLGDQSSKLASMISSKWNVQHENSSLGATVTSATGTGTVYVYMLEGVPVFRTDTFCSVLLCVILENTLGFSCF